VYNGAAMNTDQPLLRDDLRVFAQRASMGDLNSRHALRRGLADLVHTDGLPGKGLPRERIINALVAEGWERAQAQRFAGEILDAASTRAVHMGDAVEDLLKGALWFAGGLALTGVTLAAAMTGGGGVFYVFYSAVLFGLLAMARGLLTLLTYWRH
jgi:hypothetical protein